MRVPVVRQDEVDYVLSAVDRPGVLRSADPAAERAQGWISGLVDAQDRFVARVPPAARRARSQARVPRAGRGRANEGWFRASDGRGPSTPSRRSRARVTAGGASASPFRRRSCSRTRSVRHGCWAAWRCCASVLRSSPRSGSDAESRHRSGASSTRSRRSEKASRSNSKRDRRSAGARRRDENRLGGHQRASAALRARAQGARRLGPFEGRIPRHAEPRAAQPARCADERGDGAAPRAARARIPKRRSR